MFLSLHVPNWPKVQFLGIFVKNVPNSVWIQAPVCKSSPGKLVSFHSEIDNRYMVPRNCKSENFGHLSQKIDQIRYQTRIVSKFHAPRPPESSQYRPMPEHCRIPFPAFEARKEFHINHSIIKIQTISPKQFWIPVEDSQVKQKFQSLRKSSVQISKLSKLSIFQVPRSGARYSTERLLLTRNLYIPGTSSKPEPKVHVKESVCVVGI